MTQVIFVRHGETLWNLEKRTQGTLNSPLSPLGEKQAVAMGERLRDLPIQAIYSSDLGRTMDTAAAISATTGVPIQQKTKLREMNFGVFEGLTRIEMMEKFPAEHANYRSNDNYDFVIPKGESRHQLQDRAVDIMNELADLHTDECIVVVSHAGLARELFKHVLGLPHNSDDRFIRNNASYNSFFKTDGMWALDVWGDVSHLAKL